MGESGRGRGVGQVICWHVHGLEGSDGAGAGGGDALLQAAHFIRQGGLVAHRGRHAAQQRRHFGTGQGVAVDVVNEEQHVAAFVAEVFRHGQAGQRHAQAVARRFVHLAVDQRDLVEHAAFLHFVIEVIAFAGALAHAGEHGEAGVLHRDVADQFHQGHRLAYARATEQADLAALGDRHDEVDHLDAGFKYLHAGGLIGEVGRLPVDGHAILGGDRAGFVHRLAQHVHDAAQRSLPTGTRIGAPVSPTAMPRRRPSVEPSAMVRTTPSPSCCCTSRVSSGWSILRALNTLGMASRGNSTSTTAPMICTIFPSLMVCS